MVTVCPPQGSNTALYHDLVKAGNGSLSEKNRQSLKESAKDIFIAAPHKEYAKKMMAASNVRNVGQVYQGFHSLPKPNKQESGFEIKMWNRNGTYTTPWYGENYMEE